MRRYVVWCGLTLAPGAWAGPADVEAARLDCDPARVCRVEVTVRHADDGWAHYADRWEILTLGGELIATRVLLHPHDAEQPFTRDLGGVRLPAGTTAVIVRAHDKLHGFGGRDMQIAVPGR